MDITTKSKRVYKENYLLKVGILIFIGFTGLGIILKVLGLIDETSSRGIRFNDINIYQLIIGAVIVAPLLEELTFRGIFTQKKYLKYVSYLLIFISILLQKSYFLIALVIVFVLLCEFKPKKQFHIYTYFLNALIFSLIHYKFLDLFNISAYPNIFGTLGLALVFIWLVINFGLWASILGHFVVNSLLIVAGIIGYENYDQSLHKVETDHHIMTYQYVSLFEKNQTISYDSRNNITATNISMAEMNRIYCPNSPLKDIYFGKFNITIKRKSNSGKKLDCQSFKTLLEKTKINKQ